MGAIAEAVAAYIQPLLHATDGSLDQMNKAASLGHICWNLALLPAEACDESLATMRASLNLDDDDKFEEFRRSVVIPMIRRHEEMFPHLHQRSSMDPSRGAPRLQPGPTTPARIEKYPGTGRNARCPCNSGRKYKHCCGR
jgi:hypothetical protein